MARRATYDEVAKKLYELQQWACERGVAVVAFSTHGGRIVTMDHSECPKVPIQPSDSMISKGIRDIVIAAVNEAGAKRAADRGEDLKMLVVQTGEDAKRD